MAAAGADAAAGDVLLVRLLAWTRFFATWFCLVESTWSGETSNCAWACTPKKKTNSEKNRRSLEWISLSMVFLLAIAVRTAASFGPCLQAHTAAGIPVQA